VTPYQLRLLFLESSGFRNLHGQNRNAKKNKRQTIETETRQPRTDLSPLEHPRQQLHGFTYDQWARANLLSLSKGVSKPR
ncbi:MAG: hypothetical protein VXZ63_10885, partial [Planctomycetota bacterium]|nr:hypothetical protein [Planctomycetota bacterium]